MQILTSLDRDRIAELRRGGEFFWLDLHGDADLDAAGEIFGLHPMVVEALRESDQRPKLDDYGDYVLLVFYGARLEAERPRLTEVKLIVHGEFLITVHRDPCPELDDLHRQFAAREPGSEQFVVYRVVDSLTDTFFPILSSIDDDIDVLENTIVERPDDEQLRRIFGLKRVLVQMRKVITPQRDLFVRAGEELIELPGLQAGSRDYFRDVYDHLIRISDLIDTYRDLLTGAMDVYLSTVSNNLNVVMKRLTVVATVFLPLSFVTGFFGQNFGWLVNHIAGAGDFLVFGVGSLLVSCVLLVIWFRRRGIT